jgi:hypothetical protein
MKMEILKINTMHNNYGAFMKTLLRYLLFIIIIFFAAGCSDSGINEPGSFATIQGKFIGSSDFGKSPGIEGAHISLAKINDNGSLEMISENAAVSGEGGKFTIKTNQNVSGLVVIAKKNGKEYKSVIAAEARNGITLFCQPINDESTAEAEVYIEARSSRYDISYAEVAYYVDAKIAAGIKGKKDNIKDIAEALKIESETQAEAMAHASLVNDRSKYKAVIERKAMLQAALERDLYFAETDRQVDAAIDNYENQIIDAYLTLDIAPETGTKVMEISHKAFKKKANNNSSYKLQLKKNTAMIRVKFLGYSLHMKFTSLGANEAQLKIISNAVIDLKIAVSNATTKEDIEEAFENFQKIIFKELGICLNLQPGMMVNIKDKVAGFKLKLKIKIKGNNQLPPRQIVDEYAEFFADTKVEVVRDLTPHVADKAAPAAEILILSNVNFE